MSFATTGKALDRMPLKKRSRVHLVIGMSARRLRRAEAAEARKAARATSSVSVSKDYFDGGGTDLKL